MSLEVSVKFHLCNCKIQTKCVFNGEPLKVYAVRNFLKRNKGQL